jgi:hypothetical protein
MFCKSFIADSVCIISYCWLLEGFEALFAIRLSICYELVPAVTMSYLEDTGGASEFYSSIPLIFLLISVQVFWLSDLPAPRPLLDIKGP